MPRIMVCMVSSDYRTAARLVNSHSVRGIAGYIHPAHDNLERSCLNILTYLNRRVNSTDGFLLVHGNRGMECNIMLANLLRFVFRDIEKNQDFESLPKLPTWGIRWGEYRDASDMIACADREKKEQKDWNRALRETKGDEGRLVSSFWYEAELQDSDCSGKALCFLQFENCSLQNMNFGKADLIGARFRNCTLKTCDFRGM